VVPKVLYEAFVGFSMHV